LSSPFAPAEQPPTSSSTPSNRSSPSRIAESIVNPNAYGGQRQALNKVYAPRIFGFKVSERARSGPRMRWLRERPERYDELDDVDWKGRWKKGKGAVGEDEEGIKAEGRNGRLFDDDDDDDEEEEEEEEEDVPAAAVGRVR
jgi:casein kinase II subunit beta